MANSDLAFRFTEEKYASKSEVMKDLNTSLVDNIWLRHPYALPSHQHGR